MNFLKRLQDYMSENDLKQKDIVERSGVSKSYLSLVLKEERQPNKKLLDCLSNMSGKSINWWLNGVDDYDNLYSLNTLIDEYIRLGCIKSDGSMNDEEWNTLLTMLKKEIRVKLKKHNI